MSIRLDPIIDQDPSTLPEPAYYGWGSSNQLCRTRIPAMNLEAGFTGANQQQEFYVEDLSEPVANLQQEITIIQGDIVTINNSIVTIEGDITNIDADLTVVEAQIAALQAIPPVSVGAPDLNVPNGAKISPTNVLQLGYADENDVGIVSTTNQSFAGQKFFKGKVEFENPTGGIAVVSDIYTGRTTNSVTGVIKIANTWMHNYSSVGAQDTNLFVGNNAGNFTNASIQNTAVGNVVMTRLTTGGANVAMGASTGDNITTGNSNVVIGNQAAFNLTTGNENIIIGGAAGSNIVNGSSNIILDGAPANGTGQIVIGKTGTHTSCNIAGIGGIAAGGTPQMVVIDPATNKLGSQAIAGGGGITSLSAIGSTPNANGATITGVVLNLQKADTGFGGVISTDAQGFTGEKTFATGIKFASAGAIVSGNLNYYEVNVNLTTGIAMIGGTVTTILVRGVSVNPNTFFLTITRLGNIVWIKFPAFKITAATSGQSAISLPTLLSARFRPPFDFMSSDANFQNATANNTASKVVIGASGQIDIYRADGNNWSTDFGAPQDFVITYTI